METDVIYVDAGTKNNGKEGQESRICVHDGWEAVVDEVIGNFTNNEAELLAIAKGFELARKIESAVEVLSDSMLAVNMVNRKWRGKKPELKVLRDSIIVPDNTTLTWVPRDQNLAGHHIEENYAL